MRRSNMGRGRGRGGPQADRGSAWGGPLMIEHLTINNLNKELENLRRKREGIRRQQEMLNMESQFHRKRQYESQQSNHDFSNMYGNVWESSLPKRFLDSPQVKPWMEGAGPDRPRPLMEKPVDFNYIPPFNNPPYNQGRMRHSMNPQSKPIVHPILKPGVSQRGPRSTPHLRKNFKPTKITKNKPQAPNNLNSYPLAERKNLINKAVTPQKSSSAKSDNLDPLILHADQPPSPQITGRLELALGNLVKEFKNSFTENVEFAPLIEDLACQKVMKQAVRERIRQAMIGQKVDNISKIIEKYREKFPKDTDKEIVDLVIKANEVKKLPFVDSDDPEEFFKANVSKIIDSKMEEIFTNLVKMSSNRRLGVQFAYSLTDKKDTDKIIKKEVSNNEDDAEVIRNFTGLKITLGDKKKLQEFYTKLIENIVEDKITEALPNYQNHIIKIFDMDRQYRSIKFATIKRIRDLQKNKKISGAKVSESPKEHNATQEEDKLNQETKEEELQNATELAIEETLQNEESAKEEEIQKAPLENGVSNENCTQATTPAPLTTTPAPPTTTPAPPITTPKKDPIASNTPKTSATPSLELPYYVKLFGRPTLPTRAAIHEFLKEYHPVSIKKHKTINNLLVVGFSNEDDYNKIVTATETVIGNITIIIKANEKAPAKENESSNNATGTPKREAEKSNDATLLSPNLENQINDLLSTIREEDENILTEDSDAKKAQITDETKTENPQSGPEVAENSQGSEQENGTAESVKESGRATPVRTSSRLANVTPSTIRTRRASRLLQE